MELQIQNGDYVTDGCGGLERVEGTQALLQRVLFRLKAHRGQFPFLETLGSRLWQLGQVSSGQRQAAAEQYVAEALAEEPEAGMTLLGRTVSWTETNDEGRTLICAVELQERGAFPRYVKAVYRLVTDEGEPDGEERLFDAAGEL